MLFYYQKERITMKNKDDMLMEIQADEQWIKNYQAIYYAMNAKPDCRSKLFERKVIITLEDLRELNKRVTEKFKAHYDNAGFRINVSISFKNKESIEFDSWATFENYDLSLEKAICSILIVWEYNAKLPGYQLPQKHTLSVRMADEIKPEEMLNLVVSGKLEEVDKLDQEVCPIVARVDFINALLGDELLRIVELWNNGLLAYGIDESGLFRFLKKYSRIIAYIINYTSFVIAVICSTHIIKAEIRKLNIEYVMDMKIDDLGWILCCIIYCVVICLITYKLFQIIANIFFVGLKSGGDSHTFNITNGDKNLCIELQKKVKNKKIKVLGNMCFTFVFNIICSVFANYIS